MGEPHADTEFATHGPRVRYAYVLMFGSAAAFASMSACAHALGHRCDWRFVLVTRGGLVWLFAFLIARRGGVPLVWRGSPTLWVRSLTGSLAMLCTFYALPRLPVSTAVTLFNTFPFWVALLSWPALRRRPTAAVWVAIACGIVGVYLVSRGSAEEVAPVVTGTPIDTSTATACALAAAVCTAVVMLGLHRLRDVESLAIVVHFSAVATVIGTSFSLALAAAGAPLSVTGLGDPATLALLAGVGGFATLGQIAMTRAFGIGAPDRLAVIGLTQVLFSLGFDLVVWDRSLGPVTVAGIALIGLPAAWLVRQRPA